MPWPEVFEERVQDGTVLRPGDTVLIATTVRTVDGEQQWSGFTEANIEHMNKVSMFTRERGSRYTFWALWRDEGKTWKQLHKAYRRTVRQE